MLYAVLMLFFFALAYFAVGLRPLLVVPDATVIMLQGWSVQWGLYTAIAAFFMVFWVLRIFNKEYFSGRSQYGAFLPFIGLIGFTALLWLAALTHPIIVVHGFVTWISPNLTTYYGIGFTVLAIVCAVFYLGLVPLITMFLYMRKRRGLGTRVLIKDMSIWLGLLLIFIGVLANFALLFISPLTYPVIATRALVLIGVILVWFGYRLANIVMP